MDPRIITEASMRSMNMRLSIDDSKVYYDIVKNEFNLKNEELLSYKRNVLEKIKQNAIQEEEKIRLDLNVKVIKSGLPLVERAKMINYYSSKFIWVFSFFRLVFP
jgi:hypothetical protein